MLGPVMMAPCQGVVTGYWAARHWLDVALVCRAPARRAFRTRPAPVLAARAVTPTPNSRAGDDEDAGPDCGQAQRQVADHVDDGDHPGALGRSRQRHDRPQPALEPAAEAGPGNRGAGEAQDW